MRRNREIGSVTVVSVYPLVAFSGSIHSLGNFEIPAAPDCEQHGLTACEVCLPHSETTIFDRNQAEDLGEKRSIIHSVPAEDIGADLVRETHGVFVAAGDKPTKAELVAARAEMFDWFKRKLVQADDDWNKWHDRKMISESSRLAARLLGHQREWVTDTLIKSECPSCGTFNKPGLIRCTCGAVFDWQESFEMGLLTARQEEMGIAQGKIKVPKRKYEKAEKSAEV